MFTLRKHNIDCLTYSWYFNFPYSSQNVFSSCVGVVVCFEPRPSHLAALWIQAPEIENSSLASFGLMALASGKHKLFALYKVSSRSLIASCNWIQVKHFCQNYYMGDVVSSVAPIRRHKMSFVPLLMMLTLIVLLRDMSFRRRNHWRVWTGKDKQIQGVLSGRHSLPSFHVLTSLRMTEFNWEIAQGPLLSGYVDMHVEQHALAQQL